MIQLEYAMCLPHNKLKYVPLTKCLSRKEEEEIQERKGTKCPRDVNEWFAQIWDDPPQIDEERMGSAGAKVDHHLEMRSKAFALVGAGHLGGLRLKDAKFIQCYNDRPSPESGLRAPLLSEALAADKSIEKQIYSLVNDQKVTLDDAVHEIMTVRSLASSVLQPRPKTITGGVGKGPRSRPEFSKGKPTHGKGSFYGATRNDNSGGKATGAKNANSSRLPSNRRLSWHLRNPSTNRQVCLWYHTSSCSFGSECKFDHACPVDLPDGSMCESLEHNALGHSKGKGKGQARKGKNGKAGR